LEQLDHLERAVGVGQQDRSIEAAADREPSVAFGASQDRARDHGGHRAQLTQRPVAMHTLLQIDLRHRIQAHRRREVDQQPDVHAVAGEERDGPQRVGARSHLTGERLQEAGKLGVADVEQRPGGQLGHASTGRGHQLRIDAQRPPVEALGECERIIIEQRRDEPFDEHRIEVADVAVHEAHEVGVHDRERTPQRFAFADQRRHVGQDALEPVHRRARDRGDLGGPIR
jgi:hypothetical protein